MSDLVKLKSDLTQQAQAARNLSELESLRVSFLGKKGVITELLHGIGTLPAGERKQAGAAINELRVYAESLLATCKANLAGSSQPRVAFDHTLPGLGLPCGRKHPLTQTLEEVTGIFSRLGFDIVDGREIETEWYNFSALNIPLNHPSRDAFDTFYTTDGALLRSQTSTVQVHVMENRKPPLSIVAPGKVYRPDTVDACHSFMFHQMEGLMVDEGISFSDLKGILELFLKEFFGPRSKAIFRPHFFPFTEPSAEVDVSCFICGGSGCSTCSQKGWIEVLGSGMVDPNVFKAVGYDPEKYQGFAFGFGIDRLCMLKYGINDIRLLFENNMKFLNQF